MIFSRNIYLILDLSIEVIGEMHEMKMRNIYTHHLIEIGGYNELLSTWGHDEIDVYRRLTEKNIKPYKIQKDTLYHIPHSDEMRFKHQKSSKNKRIENEKNTLLAQKYVWSKKRKHDIWNIIQIHSESFIAREKIHYRILHSIKYAIIRNSILMTYIPLIFIKNPKKILKIRKILSKKFM
jgi:hypothetical protein